MTDNMKTTKEALEPTSPAPIPKKLMTPDDATPGQVPDVKSMQYADETILPDHGITGRVHAF